MLKKEETITLKQFDSICKSISRISGTVDNTKYDELCKEITRLQDKYSGETITNPLSALKSIEQNVDNALDMVNKTYIKQDINKHDVVIDMSNVNILTDVIENILGEDLLYKGYYRNNGADYSLQRVGIEELSKEIILTIKKLEK